MAQSVRPRRGLRPRPRTSRYAQAAVVFVLFTFVPSVIGHSECVQESSLQEGLSTRLHHDYGGKFGVSEVYNTIRGAGWRTLQSLEGHEQHFPPCGVLDPNETAVQGQWYIAKDAHVVYEPRRCSLRRLSARSVRNCLKGKHIAFIGDSVTRYGYLALAYYLTKLRHLPRYHGTPGLKNLAYEHEWGGWDKFYEQSSVVLQQANDATVYEECDCFRNEDTPMSEVREYRKLSVCGTDINMPACKNGNRPAPWKTMLSYEQVFRYPSWVENALTGLQKVLNVTGPMPDVVVFNIGFHIPLWGKPGEEHPNEQQLRLGFRSMFEFGKAMVQSKKAKTQLLWKTTTACLYQKGCPAIRRAAEVANEEAAAAGWRVLDADALHRAADRQGFLKWLLWDSLHSYALVYQEVNDLLLNMLCDESCAFVPREPVFEPRQYVSERPPPTDLAEKLAAIWAAQAAATAEPEAQGTPERAADL